MPVDYTKTEPSIDMLPPRIIIYGPPKIGKTTLAASIPNNILFDYEEGSGAAKVARVKKGDLDSYDKTMAAIQGLAEQDHKFNCLTIDTVDWLQMVVQDEAAKQHGVKTVADVDYGKGFVTAQNIFKNDVLEAFDYLRREKNMMIILLAHECIRRYDNPTTQSYDRYTLKLQENNKGEGICALMKEWADCILFANQETFVNAEQVSTNKKQVAKKAKTSGNINLHTQESPAFLAGNRYGLPETLPFNWPAIEEALSNAMTSRAA